MKKRNHNRGERRKDKRVRPTITEAQAKQVYEQMMPFMLGNILFSEMSEAWKNKKSFSLDISDKGITLDLDPKLDDDEEAVPPDA